MDVDHHGWWKDFEANNIQIFKSCLFFLTLFFTLSFSLRNYFKYYQLDSQTCNQLVSRIVSSVHAVTVTSMAIWVLITEKKINSFTMIYKSFYVSLTLNIVVGNMIADIIIMSIYKELYDKTFILHHTLAIAAFYPCSSFGYYPAMTLYRLISEGSTLFINLRWILLTFDLKDSPLYTLNAFMVLITFGLCRIVPIAPMWFVMLQYPGLPLWPAIHFNLQAMLCVICIILDSLNLFWYIKIVSLVWKYFINPWQTSSSSSSNGNAGGLVSSSNGQTIKKAFD